MESVIDAKVASFFSFLWKHLAGTEKDSILMNEQKQFEPGGGDFLFTNVLTLVSLVTHRQTSPALVVREASSVPSDLTLLYPCSPPSCPAAGCSDCVLGVVRQWVPSFGCKAGGGQTQTSRAGCSLSCFLSVGHPALRR